MVVQSQLQKFCNHSDLVPGEQIFNLLGDGTDPVVTKKRGQSCQEQRAPKSMAMADLDGV